MPGTQSVNCWDTVPELMPRRPRRPKPFGNRASREAWFARLKFADDSTSQFVPANETVALRIVSIEVSSGALTGLDLRGAQGCELASNSGTAVLHRTRGLVAFFDGSSCGTTMANYSLLIGCPGVADGRSKEREARGSMWSNPDFLPQSNNGWGPALCAKYCVPLFWIGGFTPADVVPLSATFSDINGDKFEQTFIGLCADALRVRLRLRARKSGLVALLPSVLQEPYDELCEQWISYLESRFSNAIVLDASDFFAMNGFEEGSQLLTAAVLAMAALDGGQQITDVSDLEYLGALPDGRSMTPHTDPQFAASKWRTHLVGTDASGSTVWPPQPTDPEVALANNLLASKADQAEQPGQHAKTVSSKPWWKLW